MKKIAFLVYSLLLSVSLLAVPVDKGTAQRLAAQFLQEQRSADGQSSSRRAAVSMMESQQSEGAGYYVFNDQAEGGFVIVSGDDTADNAILGYSTEGTLTEGNMPEALRLSLQEYAEVVKFAQAHGLSLERAPRRASRTDVSPFIEFEWNQNGVYSSACPTDCSTGCMAVTVAVIVAHYKYPKGLPGHDNGSYRSDYYEYDYTKFNKSYSSYSSLGEMPQYMFHVANLLDTQFSTSGSSATESRFLPTMVDYLGYNKNMKSIMRSAYSAEDWDEILYNELSAGRPVNFLGEHPDLGGHSYIADGYRASDGFYHILWGWGSDCVGYFDMNVLNPFVAYFSSWGSMGYDVPPGGFTSGLKAIIGIQPETQEGTSVQLMSTDDIIKEGTAGVRATLFNWDDRVFKGQFSWALLNEDGETFSELANAPTANLNVSYKGYTTQILNIGNLGLSNGFYKLAPICKTNDEGADWNLCEGYRQKYVEVDVEDGKLTIVPHPVKNVTAEVLTYKSSTGTQYMELLLKLQNHGDDVYGYLTLNGTRDDNVKVYGSKIDIAIKAGQSQILSVFLENGGTGSFDYSGHTYTVNVDYMQKTVGTFVVDPAASSPSSSYITYQGVEFDDYEYINTEAHLYNTSLKGNVLIDNSSSYYTYYVPVKFTLKDENKNVVYVKTVMDYLKKETKGYYIEATGLQAGKKYYLTAQLVNLSRNSSTYSETVVKSFFSDFEINVDAAISYYNADGTKGRMVVSGGTVDMPANSAAVDFRTFSPDLVNLSSIENPNCIYLFAADAAVPAELDGKNVVKGDQAGKITLVDGQPVAFPVDFDAEEISYTRTFTKGNNGDGKGWETILLPFYCNEVYANGQKIDWFHSATESGLRFWLFKFSNSTDGNVAFSYEPNQYMNPNEPYIIAMPGDKWGEKYDLTNKEITFKATTKGYTAVKATTSPEKKAGFYTLKGTYGNAENVEDIYVLNNAGSFFELQDKATVNPFNAYFVGESAGSRMLRIGMDDSGTTPINSIRSDDASGVVYDLQGRRADGSQLKKGVYIVDGKKVVR